jgi:ribosome biogenesis GTPase A
VKPIEGSTLLHVNKYGMKVYQLPFLKDLKDKNKNDVYTILIVGMTGVGKSTFINSLVNRFL